MSDESRRINDPERDARTTRDDRLAKIRERRASATANRDGNDHSGTKRSSKDSGGTE